MTANEKTINQFTTRVRQLIIQYKSLKQQNDELYAVVDGLEKEISALKSQIEEKTSQFNSLKMAKMLEITEGDLDSAKSRVAKLLRDVNKCITLLSEA